MGSVVSVPDARCFKLGLDAQPKPKLLKTLKVLPTAAMSDARTRSRSRGEKPSPLIGIQLGILDKGRAIKGLVVSYA